MVITGFTGPFTFNEEIRKIQKMFCTFAQEANCSNVQYNQV